MIETKELALVHRRHSEVCYAGGSVGVVMWQVSV